jgi:hypothetical protein
MRMSKGEDGACPLLPAHARWIWAFLAIGAALRIVRYTLRFPLWEDECLLSANYLDRGFLDLLRPLGYYQVCPPGFLWTQLTVIKLLGFTEYTLRLVPFVCSMASLLMFRHVAGRLLRGSALVLAVGIFAIGYPMIRYAAEAKPYGCDLFVALAMLALAVQWLASGEQRWLWALAALVVPAVWFSYPAVFVGGGLSITVAYALARGRLSPFAPRNSATFAERKATVSSGRQGWIPWAVLNLLLIASFAGLVAFNRTAVGDVTQARMTGDWATAFPPSTQPWNLLVWLGATHAGSMLGYPFGGPHGGSTLTLLCCLAGIALLVRRRQGFLLLLLLLAPLALNFLASAVHRYPYGGHVRMTLYLGPVFCILAALGAAALVARFARPRTNRPLTALLFLLLLLAAGELLRDLSHPYKTMTTVRARSFAQWFWFEMAPNGELVCVYTDLKKDLSPGTYEYGWSSMYLCNQRIYSPRHARGDPPNLDRVSAEWPLRCVLFRSGAEERDSRPLDLWLEEMQAHYKLVDRDTYPCVAYDKWDEHPRGIDRIEVYTFVPK